MRSLIVVLGLTALAMLAFFVFYKAQHAQATVGPVTTLQTVETRSHELEDVVERAEARSAAVEPAVVEPRVAPIALSHTPTRDDRATLHVLVRARETGLPVPETRVVGVRNPNSYSAMGVDGGEGDLGELLRADDSGRVTIHPTADLQFTVIVSHSEGGELARITVPPLGRGETREITAVVATQPDLPFCIRVVDAATDLAIPGASVSVDDELDGVRPSDAMATDTEGIACLLLRSWSPFPIVVHADGMAPATVYAGAPRDRANARIVKLSLVAGVTIRAYDESGAERVGSHVELTTDAWTFDQSVDEPRLARRILDNPKWTATTDARGVAQFVGLPPGRALSGSILLAGGISWRAPDPIELKPGDHRTIVWRAGVACAIHGRAIGVDGLPKSGLEIVLQPADGTEGGYLDSYAGEGRRLTKTDADGGFEFQDVGVGAWQVGPAPGDDELAPYGQIVAVASGVSRVEVVVRVERGEPIRCRIVDPDGRPVARGWLTIDAVDQHAHHSDRFYALDGLVEKGPFRGGEYDLVAYDSERSGLAPSERVRVHAGASPVDIRLRRGAQIRARVLDAKTREPVAADVCLNGETLEPLGWSTATTERDGSFEQKGLLAGTYVVAARAADGRFGTSSPISIGIGESRDDVEILVQPGAHVRLTLRGIEDDAVLLLLHGGQIVSFDWVPKDTEVVLPVPSGRTTVRLSDAGLKNNQDVEVDLAAGAERKLVFDRGWK